MKRGPILHAQQEGFVSGSSCVAVITAMQGDDQKAITANAPGEIFMEAS